MSAKCQKRTLPDRAAALWFHARWITGLVGAKLLRAPIS